MEKHQVIFSTSSTSSPPSPPTDSKVAYDPSAHVEKAYVSSTQESDDKEITQHRYAFHTRSQVSILDDGYHWRKYGKKKVKNNKFPRSYYRCSQRGCNVKKQIQRLSEDEEIVATTYEGIHTHPPEKSTESFDLLLGNLLSNVPPKLGWVGRDC